jgi:hypothetical protein
LASKSRRSPMRRYAPLAASAIKRGSDREPGHFVLRHHFFSNFSTPFASVLVLTSCLQQSFPLAIAVSHPHLFQPSVSNENEIRKLVVNHFLLDRAVIQWRHAVGEDISTPNTNEIMVFASFFQCRLSLLVYNFLCGLLNHYQI